MTRSRAVSALVLAVSCVLAAASAAAASDAFRTTVTFSKPVRLTDGTTLKTGVPYEFQINFAGTGNTAEFEFMLPGGKHVKQPAEAVGFSAAASPGTGSDRLLKIAGFKYYELEHKAGKDQQEYREVKINPQDEYKYKLFEGDIKNADKRSQFLKLKIATLAATASVESWSFGGAGFGPNTHPKATEEGGLIIVVVPSSNSPAFFKSQFKLGLSPPKPASAPMNKN